MAYEVKKPEQATDVPYTGERAAVAAIKDETNEPVVSHRGVHFKAIARAIVDAVNELKPVNRVSDEVIIERLASKLEALNV